MKYTSNYNNYTSYFTKSYAVKGTLGLFGSICTALLINSLNYVHKIEDVESVSSDIDDQIEKKLKNDLPDYIEVSTIQNLFSLPRYKIALFSAKIANRYKTRENYERVIDELSRLKSEKNRDEVINDAFVYEISHILPNDLMIELALKAPQVDNHFFRSEPPTTIQKVNRIAKKKYSKFVKEDSDYGLIFEYFYNFAPNLMKKKYKKKSPIKAFIDRIESEIKSLLVSDYFMSDRANVNVWSTSDYYDLEYESDIDTTTSLSSTNISSMLKKKLKDEFIIRNEMLIMKLIEKLANENIQEFISMNGLELLILLYEKHKYDKAYLNSIGNCLCLASLNIENYSLLIQSGWLKRLAQMSNKVTLSELSDAENCQLNLIRELISYKVLFNMNQSLSTSNIPISTEPSYYSTMLYPLNPMDPNLIRNSSDKIDYDSELIKLVDKHEHLVDIIYIHGLRGSLFRTWPQGKLINEKKKKK